MEISDLRSVVGTMASSATRSATEASQQERQREAISGDQGRAARPGGEVFKAVGETLAQFGVKLGNSSTSTVATASQATDAENAASAAEQTPGTDATSVSAALHGFMHSLYQAAGEAAGSNASGQQQGDDLAEDSANRASRLEAYSTDLATGLNTLAQSLTSASDSSGTESAGNSELDAAYQNLMAATQAESKRSSETPDLKTFIQSLQRNLTNSGLSLDSAGNLVNTHA